MLPGLRAEFHGGETIVGQGADIDIVHARVPAEFLHGRDKLGAGCVGELLALGG
jgi:hypothetical protein